MKDLPLTLNNKDKWRGYNLNSGGHYSLIHNENIVEQYSIRAKSLALWVRKTLMEFSKEGIQIQYE